MRDQNRALDMMGGGFGDTDNLINSTMKKMQVLGCPPRLGLCAREHRRGREVLGACAIRRIFGDGIFVSNTVLSSCERGPGVVVWVLGLRLSRGARRLY